MRYVSYIGIVKPNFSGAIVPPAKLVRKLRAAARSWRRAIDAKRAAYLLKPITDGRVQAAWKLGRNR
jgi:hypothetical protein